MSTALRGGWLLMGVAMLAAVVGLRTWQNLGASRPLQGSRSPPWLWRVADLPSLPPEDNNGFSVLQRSGNKTGKDSTSRMWNDRLSKLSWNQWKGVAAELHAYRTSPTFESELQLLDTALARPRFADACSPDYREPCALMATFRLWKLADLRILDDALRGDWAAAFVGVAVLLRAQVDHLVTTRQMRSAFIAVTSATATMRLMGRLLDGLGQDPAPPPEVHAHVEAIARLLARMDSREPDIHRAIVFEYIEARTSIESMGPKESRVFGRRYTSWGIPWVMFDRARTVTLLNEHFRALERHVNDPAHVPPPSFQDTSKGRTVWFYNPIGKMLLGATITATGPRLKPLMGMRTALHDERLKLLARLESMFAEQTPIPR